MAPYKGMLWIFKEIHNAAQQELENEAETITFKLKELYMMLEIGEITDKEFDEKEKALLDRLDEIEGREDEGEK